MKPESLRNIKRWDWVAAYARGSDGKPEMVGATPHESPDGDWVLYDDVVATLTTDHCPDL